MRLSPKTGRPSSNREKILDVVQRIPRGRVANYGQVAAMAGLPRQARQVGYALAATDEEIPWHRVVNAKGEISGRAAPEWEKIQRSLLESEDIVFDENGRLDIETYRWRPGSK